MGWLSEGNGQLILFDGEAQSVMPSADLAIGQTFYGDVSGEKLLFKSQKRHLQHSWQAEGELNIVATQGDLLSYIDAREVGGLGFATVEQEDEGYIAWIGRVVEMGALIIGIGDPLLGGLIPYC